MRRGSAPRGTMAVATRADRPSGACPRRHPRILDPSYASGSPPLPLFSTGAPLHGSPATFSLGCAVSDFGSDNLPLE
ncbi:hypothetical protein [Singulisphaera acidiphila]|uniref:hypothetical protein n=1 Tax=Singulisphaera acidiphila TaxID=466153 RepID=UPI0012B64767|nr:hypothetical protein [Singulisphaera acidiphila]